MYDEPVAVPIIDLLDSNMMSQYISAAREQYNQALQEQKEFAKEFGELYGPNANINKQFYDQTKGAVNNAMDYLYQNGIDPIRSAEGRAYIAKVIREIPYAEIANLKAQNESMKTYQKYRAEAMRNGTYDPDFEKFALGGKTLETWDPSTDGMWTREAPSKYQDIQNWTDHLFNGMQLSYDEEATKKAGGLYQVYSKSPEKMKQILDANMNDLLKSDLGRYYLDMYGGDTEALKQDIINRNRKYTQIKKEGDSVAMQLNNQRFQAGEAAKQRAFQHRENELNRKNQRDIAAAKSANNGNSKNGGADGGYSYSYTKKVKNAETAAGLRDSSGKLNSNLDPAKVQSMTEQQLKDLIRLRQSALSKSVTGPVTATTVIRHLSRTGDDPAVFGTRHGLTGVPGSKSKKINYTVNGSTTLYSAQDIYNSMSGRRVAWKGKITNIVDKNGRIIKLNGGDKLETTPNNVKNPSRIEDFIGDPNYSVVMRPTTNGETISVVGRDGKLHTYDAVDIYIGTGKGSNYKDLNRTPIRSYVPVSGTDLSVDELGISADHFIAKKNGYKTNDTTVENPSDFDY